MAIDSYSKVIIASLISDISAVLHFVLFHILRVGGTKVSILQIQKKRIFTVHTNVQGNGHSNCRPQGETTTNPLKEKVNKRLKTHLCLKQNPFVTFDFLMKAKQDLYTKALNRMQHIFMNVFYIVNKLNMMNAVCLAFIHPLNKWCHCLFCQGQKVLHTVHMSVKQWWPFFLICHKGHIIAVTL